MSVWSGSRGARSSQWLWKVFPSKGNRSDKERIKNLSINHAFPREKLSIEYISRFQVNTANLQSPEKLLISLIYQIDIAIIGCPALTTRA